MVCSGCWDPVTLRFTGLRHYKFIKDELLLEGRRTSPLVADSNPVEIKKPKPLKKLWFYFAPAAGLEPATK